MPKKVQFNDKPYIKEDYRGLQLIGTPNNNCEVSDDVFDGSKGILRPYMVPMFKKEPYNISGASAYQGKLDLYTGNVKKMLDRPQKKENVPLWKPFKETYLLNKNDIYNRASADESARYYNDSFLTARQFEFPVEPVIVKRGLGLGYTAEGDPNPFHSQWRPPVKTVDELRGWVRPDFDIGRVNVGVSENALGVNPITNPMRAKTRRQDAVYGLGIKDTIIPGIFKGDFGTPCTGDLIEKRNKKLVLKSSKSGNLFRNADGPLGQENFNVEMKEPRAKTLSGTGVAPFMNLNDANTEGRYDVKMKDPRARTLNGTVVAPFMNLNDANTEGRYDVEIKERRLPVLRGSGGQLKPLYYQSYIDDKQGKKVTREKKEMIRRDVLPAIEGESTGFIQKLAGLFTRRENKNDIRTDNTTHISIPTSITDSSGKLENIRLKLSKEVANVRDEAPMATGPIMPATDRSRHRARADKLRVDAIRMSGAMNSGAGVEMPRGDMKDVRMNVKKTVLSYRDPDMGPRVQGHVKTDTLVPLNRISIDADPQIFPPLTAPQLAGFNNQVILGENTKKNRRILYGARDEPNFYSTF